MNDFIPSRIFEELTGCEIPEEAFIFAFRNREILLAGNELPRRSDFPDPNGISGLKIGTLQGIPCIGIQFPTAEELPLEPKPIRAVIHGLDDETTCAICRAKKLIFWRNLRRFCGSCGTRLQDSSRDIARICPDCGERFYPQLAPAVITAVLRRDEILLAHNRNFTPGIFSLIAGFVEAGETLEQAVAREIMEETSLKVKNIRYYSSQPWPFPNSLMLGFIAEYDSGEIQTDGEELEAAGWFNTENLPLLPDHGSIARRIIEDFKANRL